MPDEAYTEQELIQFICRADAIAPIWIEDIPKLTEFKHGRDLDAWHIGTIPSRLFRIVGVVLHTLFYDNESNWRTVYVVDDGTGCLEINQIEYKPNSLPVRSKKAVNKSPRAKRTRDTQPTPEDFKLSEEKRGKSQVLGWTIGRFVVRVKHREWGHYVELVSKEAVRSVQEEVDHWKQVMRLHQTKYCEPFVIPPLPPPPVIPPQPTTPRRSQSSKQPPSASQPPVFVSPIKEHLQNDALALLRQPPSSLKSNDLHFKSFILYLMFFMRHDSIPDHPPTHTSDPQSRQPDPPSAGFTFEYLHRVPDLRYLARRILLAEARRGTRDYLKAKRSALEPTDSNRLTDPKPKKASAPDPLYKPTPLTNETLTAKIDKMFALALRKLFDQGDIVLGSGKGRPIPYEMANPPVHLTTEYPQCLGKFRLWASPPPFTPSQGDADASTSRISSRSRVSTASSKRSWRAGLQDHDGPIDSLRPLVPVETVNDETGEVYYVASPELMKNDILRAIRALNRRKERGQLGGGSPRDILTALIRLDEKWRKMNEMRVVEALELLSKEEKVWNHTGDVWTTM